MSLKKAKTRGIKIAAILLSALMLCGCAFGCGKKDKTPAEPAPVVRTSSPANVWYAPGTQKVRSDLGRETYVDFARTSVSVKMGKAEYESAQIIMSAFEDISAYDLTVSDLSLTGNASVKFKAENISVYNQHYIEVAAVREVSPGTTPGMYPDALIPFAAAVKRKENKAAKDTNQGVWVTFHTPENCTAGTYTGEFTLTMDGFAHKVPVSLTVRDYDFAKNHTAQNCFLIDWTSFSYAELDSSQEMYDAYAKALLDYRLQPGLLMNDYLKSDPDDILYYADKAFELAQDPRCTVVFMPFDVKNDNDTYLLADTVRAYFRAFVNKSLDSYGTESQLNMVAKTRTYFTFIDEPTMNPALIPRVNRAMRDFDAIRTQIEAEFQTAFDKTKAGMSESEQTFRQEVIDAIGNVRAIVTGPHDSRMKGVEVYCPLVDEYDSEQNRSSYAQDKERWWYTAVGPRYPYPNYHIDNTSLLSARLLSWMQAEYGVIGNLYWATNLYNAYTLENFIEDPYDYALRYSYNGGANGDGFLFYPGKRYGVNGPVGTVRLQAIRDGLEEYEVLSAVQDIYRGIDDALGNGNNTDRVKVDFSGVYERMRENVYSGTSVYTTQEHFDAAEDLLGNLAELAGMGGAVASVENKEGAAVVKIIVPNGITVNYQAEAGSGKSITEAWPTKNGETSTSYTMYTITQPLLQTGNVLECTVASNDKTITLRINLGGAITSLNAAALRDGVKTGVGELSVPAESTLVKANTVDTALSGDDQTQWLKLDLPQATAQVRQTLLITDAELLGKIGAGTQKLVLRFYNNREEQEIEGGVNGATDEGKYAFRLQFKYANSQYYTEIRQDQLRRGYNVITVGNLYGYNWSTLGALTEIRIFLGETGSAATGDIYFIGADAHAL